MESLWLSKHQTLRLRLEEIHRSARASSQVTAEMSRQLTCLGGPVGRAVAALPAEVLPHGLAVRRRRGAISRHGRRYRGRISISMSVSQTAWLIRLVEVVYILCHFVMKGATSVAISWDPSKHLLPSSLSGPLSFLSNMDDMMSCLSKLLIVHHKSEIH